MAVRQSSVGQESLAQFFAYLLDGDVGVVCWNTFGDELSDAFIEERVRFVDGERLERDHGGIVDGANGARS